MKKNILLLLLLFTYVSFADSKSSYIVKIKNNVETKDFIENIQSQNIVMKQFLPEHIIEFNEKNNRFQTNDTKTAFNELTKYYLVEIHSSNQNVLENLRNNENIESIEPNYMYRVEGTESSPNDPQYKNQWALKNIQAFEAWEKATGKGILMGIIDTGIDYYHPDLVNQLWINEKEDLNKNGRFEPWNSDVQRNGIFGDLNGLDDDGNGYPDDVIGYDFVDQTIMNIGDAKDIDADVEDEYGHGTSVAGVIAAEGNNNLGIIGVAYDAKIITMRAFDFSGNAESDDIAASIVYATLQGAKALNFSFGEVYSSTIIHDAVKFAYSQEVVMAASSGNNNWTLKHYPSDYDEVISVGGSTSGNGRYGLSNYGNRLDILAPGLNVLTTTRDSSYSSKNGTSFSAPHVIAASALLLEIDKTLTPREISGILQSSANDFGEKNWDIEFASGIINLKNAVNSVGKTIIEITSPKNESFIDRDNNSKISITGSVATPLFDSYEFFFGEGERPKVWQKITDKNYEQILNNTLAEVNTGALKDTTYTFRLIVNLKNDNTIEKRFYIQTFSSQNNLKITRLNCINSYFNERMIPVIFSVTNYPSYCRIKFRPKGSSQEYKIISEFQKFTVFHTIAIEEYLPANVLMEAICEVELPNGYKSEEPFEFAAPVQYAPENSFNQKDYGFPLSYLLNEVKDFYGDNKPCVVVNDLSSGTWGNIKVYQFKTNAFFTKDTFNESWIPSGLGDSNGDGINEIFATSSGSSVLYQAVQIGESPFTKLLFKSNINKYLWAADMLDLDKDGNDELMSYSDSGFYAYKFENNKYGILDSAKPNVILDTYPGFASGDFDNDGNIEICFGTREGNIFIYDFKNGNFTREFNDSSTISSSEQYIESADIDGDKIPEIVIGNFGSTVPFGKEDASNPIWTYRILKADSPDKYKILDTIHIYGVRGGIDYKNGLAGGDVDGDSTDEIIISAFPNLYIFKWNGSEFVPIWNYPYTYSNSAIVYDFDKNGINEVGFSTFGGVRFFEMDKVQKPGIPLGFTGWSVDTNKAYFEWQAVDNAQEYELLNMIKTETGYTGYTAAITSETNILLDTLSNNTHYEFVIRAFNQNLPEEYGNLSNFIDILTHKPVEPVFTEAIDHKQIFAAFSGKIPVNFLNAGDFTLRKDNEIFCSISSALVSNDSSAVLTLLSPMGMGDYELEIKSFRDKYNSPTVPKILTFEFKRDEPDIRLYLKQISVIDATTLYLTFSEDIDNNTCLNKDNYSLVPYGEIVAIDADNDNTNSVFIYLEKNKPLLATGKNYTLTVKNVVSATGTPITTGAGSTIGFVFFSNGVSNPYVYPNPIKLSDNKEIYFADLPSKAEIIIYNLDMKEIRRLYENDGNGGTEWDCRDENAEILGSGVYLFKVIQINADGSNTESELKKFVIISK